MLAVAWRLAGLGWWLLWCWANSNCGTALYQRALALPLPALDLHEAASQLLYILPLQEDKQRYADLAARVRHSNNGLPAAQ